MQNFWNEKLATRLLVFAPVVVLTVIFVVLLGFVVQSAGSLSVVNSRVVIVGGAAYVVSAALVIHYGLVNIDKLETLGLTDSLSNVPNRRALHQDFANFAVSGEERALALVDLDGFKAINDQYGHFVGDRVIKECASVLADVSGNDARFYRLGGDEFALLVMGPIAANILEGLCRTLITRLQKSLTVDDRRIALGASIGLARSTGKDGISSSELLRRADMAMYASKAAGKMRCTWFTEEFDRRREETAQIEADLRRALDRDEFRVHYQPLVDARTGQIVVVEALLRWERPDNLRIGPDVFIPIAEESGLIDPIGLWVLRQSCIDALPWGNVKLSVNVSAAQLRNSEFPIQLGQVLEETGFPPSRLEIEVTETYLVGDTVAAGRSLDVIRDFGVGVVLDDFGTGYASIGFLRKFRFEKLKLDRSLVVDAASDDGSRAMMVSSIAVARAMNMGVTAEGIETEALADLVRTAGCDQMQGWLYSKAVSAEEVSVQIASSDRLHGKPNLNQLSRIA